MYEHRYFNETGFELLEAHGRYRLTLDAAYPADYDVAVRVFNYNDESGPLTVFRKWQKPNCCHIVLDGDDSFVAWGHGQTEAASWKQARVRIESIYGPR